MGLVCLLLCGNALAAPAYAAAAAGPAASTYAAAVVDPAASACAAFDLGAAASTAFDPAEADLPAAGPAASTYAAAVAGSAAPAATAAAPAASPVVAAPAPAAAQHNSSASRTAFKSTQKLEAPVVRCVPHNDGSVTVSWTESPLISDNGNEDWRTYTLYLYRSDKPGELSPIYEQAFIANPEMRLTTDWLLTPGKRYTVIVAAVNNALPSDDPNAVAASEPVSFTPHAPSAYPLGDVNANGVVNTVDAQIAYDIATRTLDEDFTDYANLYLRADATGDGEVHAEDAFAIQYLALRG